MTGVIWLIGILIPFILVQTWLHREIQQLFFYITRNVQAAIGLFSILFFPGITLHELSHLLAAWMLRVPVRKISLVPQLSGKKQIRLGYVETAQTSPVRDAIIGAAPIISGTIIIAVISYSVLNFPVYFTGDWSGWGPALLKLPSIPDFWIWFYFIFVISSTMLPSASDRHCWLPILGFATVLFLIVLMLGAGPWLKSAAAPVAEQFLSVFSAILLVSLLAHMVLALPLFLLRLGIEKAVGYSFLHE